MQEIQIALREFAKAYAADLKFKSVVNDIPSTFTTKEKCPFVNEPKKGWVIMVAHRPLFGTKTKTGPSLYGVHWAALDPADDLFEKWVKENAKLDARIVRVLEEDTMWKLPLVNNRYADKYLQMPEDARKPMLSGKLKKLEGIPYADLDRLINAVQDL